DGVEPVRHTLLHGSAAKRSQPRAPTVYGRRTYSGRPSSSMRFSDATAMATSVVCRPSVRERSASPITGAGIRRSRTLKGHIHLAETVRACGTSLGLYVRFNLFE